MKPERIKMTVEMEVTAPQALALEAMFIYWNQLASMGSSRKVAYYVDGDGNFKPKCKITYTPEGTLPELTEELKKAAIVEDKHGDRVYDFDPIAWRIRDDRESKLSGEQQ